MSVESMAIALHHSQASGAALNVLWGIANHDGDGGAFPAIATLAKYARKDARTVQRALNRLVELGEVVVHYNAGGTATTPSDRRPNLYEFVLACPDECDRTKNHRMPGDPGYGVTRMSPRPIERGDTTVTSRGDSSVAHGVTRMSPKPSLEPSLEPVDPPTPLSRPAERCAHGHRGGCRACGTNPRAVARGAQRYDAAERRRLDRELLEQQRADAAAARVPSEDVADQLDAARAAIHDSRSTR